MIGKVALQLCCPHCRGSLAESGNLLICDQCHQNYPVKNNIPLFHPDMDTFYEGRFVETHRLYPKVINQYRYLKPIWALIRWCNIAEHSYWAFRHGGIKSGGNILDLGCGGGTELFTQYGSVTGYDISFASLQKAGTIYSQVVQGDVFRLPFPDQSFDTVIASHLIGHILKNDKALFLKEAFRVLKPGGQLVLFAETDGDNRTLRFAKQSPKLYQEYFIEHPGHIGLEYFPILNEQITTSGFILLKKIKLYGFLWAVEHYLTKFPDSYGTQSGFFRWFLIFCNLINRHTVFRLIVNMKLGLVAPLFLLFESERDIGEWFLVYQKGRI